MSSLGNGQILENGLKLIGIGVEDPIAKKLKTDEAENICKSLFKDQATIAGCGLVLPLPEVSISGTIASLFKMHSVLLNPSSAIKL